MQSALPGREAERLRRLRDRFGEGVREHQVDHDHDHLTSTRRERVPVRTFFLGETWWAERFALGECRSCRESSSHRPALVTRREERPYEPIEMAPSARRAPGDIGEVCFRPAEPPEGLQEETLFLLLYRRPVGRDCIGAPMGAIGGADKQRLQRLLDLLRTRSRSP
jgi:hypothetical protein